MRRIVFTVAAIALLAGCFGRGSNDFETAASLSSAGQITIHVTNSSYAEATLHVFRGGERSRLGIVGALDEETFTVDWTQPLEMQLRIRLLAGGTCLTRPLPVEPGDVIDLKIENNLARDLDCLRVTPE